MARDSQQFTEDLARQVAGRAGSKSIAPLRALKPFIMPYRAIIAAAGVALVAAAAATLVVPAAVRGVIDHGFSADDVAKIGR